MRKSFVVAIGLAAAAFACAAYAQTPLRVLSSNGVRAVIEDLQPEIERSLGRPLAIEFSTASSLAQEIEAGATFDVAILTPPLLEGLVEAEIADAGSYVEFARAGVGVGARSDGPDRDVSTMDALKGTLLAASSVAFTEGGQSRDAIERTFEQLGIAEQMADRIVLLGPGEAPHAVEAGDAELVLTLVSEILHVPGLKLVGPLPAEVQSYISFAAVRSTATSASAAADALLQYLGSARLAAALPEHGMEPAADR